MCYKCDVNYQVVWNEKHRSVDGDGVAHCTVYVLHNNTKCALLLAVIAAEFNLMIIIYIFIYSVCFFVVVGFLDNWRSAHRQNCIVEIIIIGQQTERQKSFRVETNIIIFL